MILKQHLSGVNGSFEAGSQIEATESEAVAFIEKGIAGFKTEKELNDFIKKVESIKLKQAEDEAKANAIIRQSHIQNELNSLYEQVALKEAELNGEVLSDEDLQNAIESISKRDALDTKKAKGK